MEHLYNIFVVEPSVNSKVVPVEIHAGLCKNPMLVETALEAFLNNQIPEKSWNINNAVIIPPISDALFLEGVSEVELPIATAIWDSKIRFWTYRSFIAKITQVPVLVSSQDVTNYLRK